MLKVFENNFYILIPDFFTQYFVNKKLLLFTGKIKETTGFWNLTT